MAIMNLEHYLSLSCSLLSMQARNGYRQAKNIFNTQPNKYNEEAYFQALENWSLMVTGTEHLWRELSHLFVADPISYSLFPRLAAQHLLDGFPIELMDGDAAMVNVIWIKAILNQLDDVLSNARIFVLSIMGVQSSGKSTLLNYMFGVRFCTSVSRCTRGVNLQLLQCDDRSEYEYILLLDTEGIRSPEHIGEEDTILPADATIILTKGESTTTISEILPIVLSVFLDSELAENISGQLASKFYFVFNQIDVSQSANMEIIVNTLMENLRINAEKIEAIRVNKMPTTFESEQCNAATNKSSIRHWNTFQVNIGDEKVSDVRFLGTIKGSVEPPFDTPHEDFGKRLIDFRDYIHKRATQQYENGLQWKARSITEFNIYLDVVWNCINNSNFQLNFLAAHERMLYEVLIKSIANLKQEMAKVYTEALDQVLHIICEDEANKVVLEDNPRKYEYCMKNIVQEAIMQLDTQARKNIEEPKVAKWRQDQLIKWEKHCKSQEKHAISMVEEKVVQVFHFGSQVVKYRQQLQTLIQNRVADGNFNSEQDFPKVFEEVVNEIQQEHPSLVHDVSANVDKIFFESGLLNPYECQMIKIGRTEHEENLFSSLFEKGRSFFSRKPTLTKEDVDKRVVETIEKTLITTVCYSDDIVMENIYQVKCILVMDEIPTSLKNIGLYKLYTTLHDRMRQIQSNWDDENGILSKFKKCEGAMKEFAINLSKGFEAEELLFKTIDCWLKENFCNTVAQHLYDDIAVDLKKQNWVLNAKAMQALIDKSLIKSFRENNMSEVLDALLKPVDYTKQILDHMIKNQIEQQADDTFSKILTIVQKCINKAAECALKSHVNRTSCFWSTLQTNLQKKLKLSGTSDLVLNMPDVNEMLMNCDASGPEVFTRNDKSLISKILQTLDNEKLNKSSFASKDAARGILKNIFDVSFGANEGIVPRCGEPCPRCSCPCIKAFNHISASNDRHDTYHQPGGLVGGHLAINNELFELSCVGAVIKDWLMIFKENDKEIEIPYKDFENVFPTWALPTIQQPLPLREYIFAHCQDELATKYNRKKCSNVPAKYYSHDLDDIERQLNRQLLGS
ncbi:hypothetical protein THRCLA_11895 [Thraustotheca clavata]|uniref:VLIG-type G domain-containing protein n=1 Tax=Thraustotheca clavata TaxID=74557 RepID=A0A1V9Y5J2_9STRA|nr:hypothetical protein THRCLA_11895 [Thraustotheca clavata]